MQTSDRRCDELFEAMSESVGVKTFAANMGLSTRQIHRMLNGTQPNPMTRALEALMACKRTCGDAALDFLCQKRGGYFVAVCEDIGLANANAVKESAEAIVAIVEGRSPQITVKEIREAISALAGLERRLAPQMK